MVNVRVLVLVFGLVIAAFTPLTTVHVAAATADLVVDVVPRPAAVVGPEATRVQALVAADRAPTDVVLTIDGRDLDAAVDTAGEDLWEVTGTIGDVAPGLHHARLDARIGDVDTSRTWGFTTTDVTLGRLSGVDRYATAVRLSQHAFATDRAAEHAVLARGDDFADALTGGPLAAHLGAPLLLTTTTALPPVTDEELARVLTPGGTVHLLGGTTAISDDVRHDLEEAGYEVVRVGGHDRYATAARVGRRLPPAARVWVASGIAHPDALAASVPAGRDREPILLTRPGELPTATADLLADRTPDTAVIVGGTAAVGEPVERALEDEIPTVIRTAGANRYATAAAVAAEWFDAPTQVVLTDGAAFPDALTGAVWAARDGRPLLLTGDVLPAATAGALATLGPETITAVGGPAAVPEVAAAGARVAVVDGPDAAGLEAMEPEPGATSTVLAPITLAIDAPVTADTVEGSVTLDGRELPTTVRFDDEEEVVVLDPVTPGENPRDEPSAVVVRLRAVTTDGAVVHVHTGFTMAPDRQVYATWQGVSLYAPSDAVELVGYHQSNHEGARDQVPAEDGPPWRLLASRGRSSGRYSAADIVTPTDVPIVAPVTGTVVRAGSYVLYCDHTDNFVAIEPDGLAGFELKVLHFTGLAVSPGDRVEAGVTRIGAGARRLPFESQVDEHSSSGHGPHVHVELVDTSIPNVPNSGGGGC